MRRQRREAKLNANMNIVPYVDVMFVLLTIFMVTATTISVGIDVDPPQTDSSQAVAVEGDQMMVISVDSEGNFYFNLADEPDQALSEGEILDLAHLLFTENPNIKALVKGDKTAPYGRIIDAMSLLQRVTHQNVQLMTTPFEE
ncbi:biopolymer transporter ExbD [Ignatzschineria ureiclastica]|uniref:Biopolymer transporter ExbD n=1 Tax=Ignatzschineria ureiclastica TaxID=472582 RepID=A0A2U2AF91_9GAMM|nr:biopolymer transporter ExbD [Ignatzschineria ureiclastica]PWD81321.1 biopolymer transporter ExbD [Ignatzschineria ureiclastica]GGZ98039.1 protein TolR [Ignatzschineria ureiclastica]